MGRTFNGRHWEIVLPELHDGIMLRLSTGCKSECQQSMHLELFRAYMWTNTCQFIITNFWQFLITLLAIWCIGNCVITNKNLTWSPLPTSSRHIEPADTNCTYEKKFWQIGKCWKCNLSCVLFPCRIDTSYKITWHNKLINVFTFLDFLGHRIIIILLATFQ